MGVVLLDPAAYFEGVFLSSSEVADAWKQVDASGSDSVTVADAYSAGSAAGTSDVATGAGLLGASAQNSSVAVAEAVSVKSEAEVAAKTEERIFPQVRPEQTFTLPKVRRVPGVAFAAAPINAPVPAGQQNSLTLDALNRKQEELMRKEQDLKALQDELEERFVQMQELEMRLQIMLRDAEEIKDARYRQLVDVLANMKARQAAEVLSTLDEKVAVRVLAGMRGRQAGEILSFADPMKAARLTEALARMQMPLQ